MSTAAAQAAVGPVVIVAVDQYETCPPAHYDLPHNIELKRARLTNIYPMPPESITLVPIDPEIVTTATCWQGTATAAAGPSSCGRLSPCT
jgi:hypothetical protein